MLRYLDNAVGRSLLRWLRQPLIGGSPWHHRLRHYAMFLLLIALSSPFTHAYLDIPLTPAETIVHTGLVVAAAAVAILLIEGLITGLADGVARRARRTQPISTGAFLARAAIAYVLTAPAVGLTHALSPYTEAIMGKHASAAQSATAWNLLPVALLIIYVAYQMMRKDYLARQVSALRQINDELEAAQSKRREESAADGDSLRQPSAVIHVQSNGVEIPLCAALVVRIQADENYCHVVIDADAGGTAKRHLVRMTLKEALEKVPGGLFVQTHRSHVVNLRYVAELHRDGRRRELRLGNGDRVPVSRARIGAVESRIRDFLIAGGGRTVSLRAGLTSRAVNRTTSNPERRPPPRR